MKKTFALLVSAVALLGAMVLAPVARAAEPKPEKPKHEKKVGPRILKKYDKNHDGVLDEDEKAAWEADKLKRREERKAKKAEAGATAKEKTPADEDDDEKDNKPQK